MVVKCFFAYLVILNVSEESRKYAKNGNRPWDNNNVGILKISLQPILPDLFLALYVLLRAKGKKKRETGRDFRFPLGQGGELTAHPTFLYKLSGALFVAIFYILAVILEEIVIQYNGYFFKQCRVNALALEDTIDVCPVTA